MVTNERPVAIIVLCTLRILLFILYSLVYVPFLLMGEFSKRLYFFVTQFLQQAHSQKR